MAGALPVEFRVLERDERGGEKDVATGESVRVWTPPDAKKARALNVLHGGEATPAEREAFTRNIEGKVCRNCRYWANEPDDREAQQAKFLAWQVLTKDNGFASHHWNPNNYGCCVRDDQFTTPDAFCDGFRVRGGSLSFLLRRGG